MLVVRGWLKSSRWGGKAWTCHLKVFLLVEIFTMAWELSVDGRNADMAKWTAEENATSG
jgi:hypothetical protein